MLHVRLKAEPYHTSWKRHNMKVPVNKSLKSWMVSKRRIDITSNGQGMENKLKKLNKRDDLK